MSELERLGKTIYITKIVYLPLFIAVVKFSLAKLDYDDEKGVYLQKR